MKLNLDYYLTTDERWLRNFSDTLSEITGYENKIRENSLVLHPEVGEGMFELSTFGDGLSLLRVDCIFHTDLNLNRSPDPKNEEFIIHFNMSEDPVYANNIKNHKKILAKFFRSCLLFFIRDRSGDKDTTRRSYQITSFHCRQALDQY